MEDIVRNPFRAPVDVFEGAPAHLAFDRLIERGAKLKQIGSLLIELHETQRLARAQSFDRCLNVGLGEGYSWNNVDINIWTPEEERTLPFARMIFIGDGETDIPTMKMMTHQGGHSIAVYDADATPHDRRKIHRLISENRVNFVAAAQYTEGSQLDIIVQEILGRIARAHGYRSDGA